MVFNTIFVAMKDEILTLEDKELIDDTIKCFVLGYKDEKHHDKCCNEQDHDSANAYEVEIEFRDFNEWVNDNNLNIIEADLFDDVAGHCTEDWVLEIEDYFTDDNVLDYILKNNLLNIKK